MQSGVGMGLETGGSGWRWARTGWRSRASPVVEELEVVKEILEGSQTMTGHHRNYACDTTRSPMRT